MRYRRTYVLNNQCFRSGSVEVKTKSLTNSSALPNPKSQISKENKKQKNQQNNKKIQTEEIGKKLFVQTVTL